MIHLPPIITQLAWLLPTAAGIIILIRFRDQYRSQERTMSFFSYILKEIHTAYFSQERRGFFFSFCIINAMILTFWFAWTVPLIANPMAPTLLLISILLLSDWPLINGLADSDDSERYFVRKLVFMGLVSILVIIPMAYILHVQLHDPSLLGMEMSEFRYQGNLIDGQVFLVGLAGKLGMNLGVWGWNRIASPSI